MCYVRVIIFRFVGGFIRLLVKGSFDTEVKKMFLLSVKSKLIITSQLVTIWAVIYITLLIISPAYLIIRIFFRELQDLVACICVRSRPNWETHIIFEHNFKSSWTRQHNEPSLCLILFSLDPTAEYNFLKRYKYFNVRGCSDCAIQQKLGSVKYRHQSD